MLTELFQQLVLIVISIVSNFFSAIAGGGSGLTQLPVLILLGLPFTKALATHKIASVALGIGASIRHYKEQTLKPKFILLILFFGLPGVLLGSNLVLFIKEQLATFSLGILILFLGIYSFKIKENNKDKLKLSNIMIAIGSIAIFMIGVINGSLASGTGLFLTFLLINWFNLSYTEAVAYTLVLVGVVWNGTGAIALGINNEIKWSWIPSLIIGSFIGGYLGAHYSIIKGEKVVKKSFEILTISMGSFLIIKSIFLQS